jgi:hypothetical protein|tara:strand:+ start:11 stop:328 length:318 start_codon:yes stop_codon:yes gene_type:complete
MASGILGQAVGTGSEADIYTVPSSTFAVVNLSVINNDGSNDEAVVIRVINSGETTGAKHNIENMTVVSNGVVERTGICVSSGDKISMNASSDVSISIWGVEESTS